MQVKLTLILFICSFISACGHHTSPKQYTLQLDQYHIAPACGMIDKTLLVIPTHAAADMQSDNMLYSKQKNELDSFAKHQWAASPAKLLTTIIAEGVQQNHYFRAVATAPFAGLIDYRLSTRLTKLYQDFTRCPSHMVLQVEANLSQAKTGRLIAAKTFYVDVVTHSNTPYGGVIAANQANRIFVQELNVFLRNNACGC